MSSHSLVMFDLDGTLIDSAPDIAHALNRLLVEQGLPKASLDQVRAWIGSGAEVLIRYALASQALVGSPTRDARSLTGRFIALYRDKPSKHTRLYDGVLDYLSDLQSSGTQMALITNKPSELVAPILSQLGLSDYFCWTAGGDTFQNKKPDPEPLLACLHALNTDPSKSVMIGDSESDSLAAYQAGVASVTVNYGYGDLAQASRYSQRVVSNLKELITQ